MLFARLRKLKIVNRDVARLISSKSVYGQLPMRQGFLSSLRIGSNFLGCLTSFDLHGEHCCPNVLHTFLILMLCYMMNQLLAKHLV